ncbi:hypothetical protein VB618_12100 [Microvirga sp. CF3062]|uniref:hypothetical protein n=1 Tax=Microvirga sp. CF3062 TaxID=3110182 RepID=UPI002E7A6E41|nr:hypothetical protein [Microvirga sp. CF3062]MEE1656942.1 hypothetical protein [Microvirga sp. CF3062]
MNADQIDGLLRGATAYHKLVDNSPLGQGEVPFFFGEDGQAAARMPDARVRTGTWHLEEKAYCLNWDDGLQNSRTVLTKVDGTIVASNADTGVARSTIVRVVPGDAEGLATSVASL